MYDTISKERIGKNLPNLKKIYDRIWMSVLKRKKNYPRVSIRITKK